ncbi:MAG: hypothetical protein V1806_12680 [Pseudomonadota bacterium]
MQKDLSSHDSGLLPSILVLSLACLVSYALCLTRMGIYWDDWFLSLLYTHGGGQTIIDWHTSFRPFAGRNMGWVLGMRPLPWQVLTLVAHWLGVLCVLWGMRRLWPGNPLAALAVALIYAVYPGYSLRPIAVVSWHQLTGQNFMALSLAATIAARRAPAGGRRVGLTLLAILAALWSHLVYEAYIGLEGLRLALLWVLAEPQEAPLARRRLKAALASALPYLGVLAPYLVWRVFFFDLMAGRPDFKGSIAGRLGDIQAAPLESLFTIAVNYSSSLANALALVWTFPLTERLKWVPAGVGWATLGVVLLAAGGLLAFLLWFERRYPQASPQAPAAAEAERGGSLAAGAPAVVLLLPPTGFYVGLDKFRLVLMGGVALLLGLVAGLGGMLVPVAYGRKVELLAGVDRYTPTVALGVGLLFAAAWGGLARRRLACALLALLVAAGVGFHFKNSYYYQKGWANQQDFWWQLRWRAPSLEPGTLWAVEAPNFPGIASRYEIYSAARMAYPGLDLGGLTVRPEVAHLFREGHKDLDGLPELGLAVPLDTGQALLLSKPTGCSCLRALDKDRAFLVPGASPLARGLAAYSRPELILAQPYPRPMDPAIFGPEPAHGWCYHYQKAALARQMGDWLQVERLGQQAQDLGLAPRDPLEWLPFLEAQVRLGLPRRAGVRIAFTSQPRALGA